MALTAEQIVAAEAMWRKGLSGRQIAARLNVTLGVISGLRFRHKWVRHGYNGTGGATRPKVEARRSSLSIAGAAVGVSLLQRTASQCGWILDKHPRGPDTLMCGSPVTKGNYCADHNQIAWQPRQDRRRWDRHLGITEATS